jgi:large subunit ribosomal protein L24
MSTYRAYSPFAKYVCSNRYYYPRSRPMRLNGVDPYYFIKPSVDKKLASPGRYFDKKVDLADKEMYDEAENLRPAKELDFYQDHTYHNQWLQRDMDLSQKAQVKKAYIFMQPNYQITPWLWYPGDQVEVIKGEFSGQRGQIIAVVAYKNEAVVQNVNVQTINIPASEDRPGQDMQREHPIPVASLRFVDPHTDELTDIKVVSIRDKETGKIERRRISLASGAILPIPTKDFEVEGDPLSDTPFQDAVEETYDEDKELQTLVQRKLAAMEAGFIGRLKTAYEFHSQLARENEYEMRAYQRAVVDRAEVLALQALLNPSGEGEVSMVAEEEAEA